MLKSIPVQTISEILIIGMKHTEPASFTRLPYFEYYEKFNPRDVILSNSSLQVLVAMTYHNDYYSGCNVPVSINITPMPAIEFVSLPTIQLFPSIFKKLRVFTKDNQISGIWAAELTEEAIKAYETLTEDGKIDNCLTTLFNTSNSPVPLNGDNHEDVGVFEFELNSEQGKLDVREHYVFRNKLFMYLLSELSRNGNTVGGSTLQGWSKDELDSCEYFYELKKIFKRVLVVGWGKPWQSTHFFVSEPMDFTNLLLGSALSHQVIGKGYSY